MIQVEALSKRYGDVTAVDSVSFEVQKGEILGFLGPNGAGKTTTMRMLTGFIPASGGKASVAGFDVFKSPLEVKRRVGYLPENPPLYPEMTVDSYLDFVAAIKGVPSSQRGVRRQHVKGQCSIQDVGSTIIRKLSKGYKQRVGLAQALIHDPEVLILDEPTVGLDPKQIIEVRELIRGLGGKHTIILSTHILPEASMTCQRVIIINDGKIVAVDTPANLTHQLQGGERVRVEVKGTYDEFQRALRGLEGLRRFELVLQKDSGRTGRTTVDIETDPREDVRAQIARRLVEARLELYELHAETMSLEEIFLKLTTQEAAPQVEEKEPGA